MHFKLVVKNTGMVVTFEHLFFFLKKPATIVTGHYSSEIFLFIFLLN